MRLRKLTKMQTVNDGTRSLIESTMSPEVIVALRDWVRSTKSVATGEAAGVVIGGLGLSYHCKPSYTQDIDLLFLQLADIPDHVRGFTRIAPGEFRHDRTQAEVRVATPASIGVPTEIAERVIRTATLSNGIRVATASALVAWTLFGLRRVKDEADVVALIKTGQVDLSGWPLPPERVSAYEGLIRDGEVRSRLRARYRGG
jgi:hypothetical protein